MKLRGLFLLMLASAASSFAVGAAPRDGGLLVTRVDSSHWQIRLVGGTQGASFSGDVNSDATITSATGVGLDSNDSIKMPSPKLLSTTLYAQAGRTDGVDFAAPANAQLCLRDSSGSNVQVYFGASIAEAIPVASPVELAGDDACGTKASGEVGTMATAVSGGNRKFHPGHYVPLLRVLDSSTIMSQTIKPGVIGFMKRYSWRLLEPTQGAYNFAEITADVAWAQAHGMRLIIMPEDKTFKNEMPTPNYLSAYTFKNRHGGYTVARWDSFVVARQQALMKALGQRFDSNPFVEGVIPQDESAPSLDNSVLKAHGYTAEKYRDSLIALFTDSAKSWPTSRVFWFMNFLPQNQNYVVNVANALAPYGVVMGGPDVMPDDQSLQKNAYPYYRQFYSKMPLFGQVEGSCYQAQHMTSGYSTKYWTPAELFNYARNNLHVSYMFWVRITASSYSNSYDWYDALPVVAANPLIVK